MPNDLIPTKRVKHNESGDEMVINESDFDKKVHTEVKDDPTARPKTDGKGSFGREAGDDPKLQSDPNKTSDQIAAEQTTFEGRGRGAVQPGRTVVQQDGEKEVRSSGHAGGPPHVMPPAGANPAQHRSEEATRHGTAVPAFDNDFSRPSVQQAGPTPTGRDAAQRGSMTPPHGSSGPAGPATNLASNLPAAKPGERAAGERAADTGHRADGSKNDGTVPKP